MGGAFLPRFSRSGGGYTGGFEGWEPNEEELTYKSTEHNIDLYAAFMRLFNITKNPIWKDRAEHARNFVLTMWDDEKGKFWTGTKDDGVEINKEVISLDCQTWAILSLKLGENYLRALTYCENHHKVPCLVKYGFDFNTDQDGVWYEGTAQMAVVYSCTNQKVKWQDVMDCLHAARLSDGCLPAASKNGLTTGFDLPDGNPWLYYKRAHVGATAWQVFAETGINPFWMEQCPIKHKPFDPAALELLLLSREHY